MDIFVSMHKVLVGGLVARYRLGWPHWFQGGIHVRIRTYIQVWSVDVLGCDDKVRPELRCSILKSDILSVLMFVELWWSEAFSLMDLVVLDCGTVLTVDPGHWVISVDTTSEHVLIVIRMRVGFANPNHSIFVSFIRFNVLHILLVQDLLCKYLFHDLVRILHFVNLASMSSFVQDFIHVSAGIDICNFPGEKNTIEVSVRGWWHLGKSFL